MDGLGCIFNMIPTVAAGLWVAVSLLNQITGTISIHKGHSCIKSHLDIGTEEDSIHQLNRAAQVTIFRLGSGHCQLLSHLHRLKIFHSDECSCSTGPETPNHILQSCPTFDTLRRQTWPSPMDAHRKLSGPFETVQQTADFALLTELKIWHGPERRRRRSIKSAFISALRQEITNALINHILCLFCSLSKQSRILND